MDWVKEASHTWLTLATTSASSPVPIALAPKITTRAIALWICEAGEAHRMPRCIGSVPHSIADIADLGAGRHGILDHALHDLGGVDHLR